MANIYTGSISSTSGSWRSPSRQSGRRRYKVSLEKARLRFMESPLHMLDHKEMITPRRDNPMSSTSLQQSRAATMDDLVRRLRASAITRIEADFNRSADTHLILLQLTGYPGIDLYLQDESSHSIGSLRPPAGAGYRRLDRNPRRRRPTGCAAHETPRPGRLYRRPPTRLMRTLRSQLVRPGLVRVQRGRTAPNRCVIATAAFGLPLPSLPPIERF